MGMGKMLRTVAQIFAYVKEKTVVCFATCWLEEMLKTLVFSRPQTREQKCDDGECKKEARGIPRSAIRAVQKRRCTEGSKFWVVNKQIMRSFGRFPPTFLSSWWRDL